MPHPKAKQQKIKIALLVMVTPVFAAMVCYTQFKNTEKAQQPEEVSELVKRERDHQIKITTFDPSRYELPQANPSVGDENIVCKNGFGGKLPYLHKGMFSEPLYFLEAEKLETDMGGKFIFAPYVNAYYVVGDILFQKPLDLFDRKLVTTKSLQRNFSNIQIITGTTTAKNSYASMESKYGFPHAYLAQQAGGLVSFTSFNDQCIKGVAQKNIKYKKVDLSGLPIATILAADYTTTLHHGVNGLYNFTEKTTDFVSENFLDWIQSNNRAYLNIVNELDQFKFQKGSYLYIPTEYQNVNEVVYIDFNYPLDKFNQNQWRKDLADQNGIMVDEVEFAQEYSGKTRLLKPYKKSTMEPLGDYIAAFQAGKWYIGKWELPYHSILSGKEPYRNQLVLMNDKALASALSLFKARYQGKQVDLGTDNEDLELKYAEAVSAQSQEKLAEQRHAILNTLKWHADSQ